MTEPKTIRVSASSRVSEDDVRSGRLAMCGLCGTVHRATDPSTGRAQSCPKGCTVEVCAACRLTSRNRFGPQHYAGCPNAPPLPTLRAIVADTANAIEALDEVARRRSGGGEVNVRVVHGARGSSGVSAAHPIEEGPRGRARHRLPPAHPRAIRVRAPRGAQVFRLKGGGAR